MVRTDDQFVRRLLTYSRLVLREARRYGGSGWMEYNRIFQQQVATDPCMYSVECPQHQPGGIHFPWVTYKPRCNLHSLPGGGSLSIGLCPASFTGATCTMLPGDNQNTTPFPVSHRMRPETLERICVS